MGRPLRRVRIGAVVALIGLAGWAVVGLPFFVFPANGPTPAHADVVLALGGQTPQRIATAERLLRAGTVRQMVWSTPSYTERRILDDCHTLAHLTCFVPDPSTTQGEARELGRLASRDHWTSAIVVTQNAHIDRARTIIRRCFDGRLTMLESGEPPFAGWAYEYLYQSAATVKMWLHPGC